MADHDEHTAPTAASHGEYVAPTLKVDLLETFEADDGHTSYLLDVLTTAVPLYFAERFRARTRYSEMESYRANLVAVATDHHPDLVDAIPPLPGKKWIGNHKPEVLEARAAALSSLMEFVSAEPALAFHIATVAFLQRDVVTNSVDMDAARRACAAAMGMKFVLGGPAGFRPPREQEPDAASTSATSVVDPTAGGDERGEVDGATAMPAAESAEATPVDGLGMEPAVEADDPASASSSSSGSCHAGDRIELAYHEAGAEHTRLCVLVHGYPDTSVSWNWLLPLLADQGYHAVAFNLRGYWPSSAPFDDDYSPFRLAADVVAVVEALGGGSHDEEREPAVVVGHDWGAMATYLAASTANDGLIDRIVTIAIPHPGSLSPSIKGLWKSRHFVAYKLGGAADTVRAHCFAHVRDIYARWSPSWDVEEGHLTAVKRALASPGGVEHILGSYKSIDFSPPNDVKERLAIPTPVPALVLYGATDGATDTAVFDKMGDYFSSYVRVVLMEHGGHFCHLEERAAFEALLFEFLAFPASLLRT